MAELDWHEIKSHFNSLLAADDLHDRWYARLQAWMERSKALASRAGALDTHMDHADNPLRLEGEVTSKLDQLQQLSDEQSTLNSQFASVEKMLDSEAKQLRKKLDSENQQIASIIAERAQDPDLIEIVSLELVNWAANRSWQRVADFSEVSDRLLRAATSDRGEVLSAVNLNLRVSSQPTFQVSELQASGMFSSASGAIPYHVVSHCRQLPQATLPMHWTGWARFEFQLSDSRMQLLVDQRPQQAGVCKIQVVEQPAATLDSPPLHRLVLASDGHSLEGRFSLLSGDLQAAFGIQDESEIELAVSGSWKQPEFQPTAELPAWLRELAISKIDDSFARAREIVQNELQQSFEMRINKLHTLVAVVVRDGATASAAHQQQIAAVMTRMQQQWDVSQGIEFARRPATPEPDITR